MGPKLVKVDTGYSTHYAYIYDKGNYFCPEYCEANHPHLSHDEIYNCGEVNCYHIKLPSTSYTFVKDKEIKKQYAR